MKVQIAVNIELEELDDYEIDANNLSEVIADCYTSDELVEIIREKLKDEEDSGNGDAEYFLVD
jgi:hypothetical protein